MCIRDSFYGVPIPIPCLCILSNRGSFWNNPYSRANFTKIMFTVLIMRKKSIIVNINT